jgi:hypothetical protein
MLYVLFCLSARSHSKSAYRHPGCICMVGWEGPHCEYHTSEGYHSSTIVHGQSFHTGNSARHVFLQIAYVVIVIGLCTLTFFICRRHYRNQITRNDIATDSALWGNSYRDRSDDTINIAPRRQSDFSEAEYRKTIRSSRDPMLARLSQRRIETLDEDDDEEDEPKIYIGPPRDEDGHELHNVEII